MVNLLIQKPDKRKHPSNYKRIQFGYKNKTVYDRQYYVKRYKYYDNVFGLHGDYSLRNWQAYVPESLDMLARKCNNVIK